MTFVNFQLFAEDNKVIFDGVTLTSRRRVGMGGLWDWVWPLGAKEHAMGTPHHRQVWKNYSMFAKKW